MEGAVNKILELILKGTEIRYKNRTCSLLTVDEMILNEREDLDVNTFW